MKLLMLVLKGFQGHRAPNYVHTLMLVLDETGDRSGLVSEYVVKMISMRVKLEFVEEAKKVLPNNPSWLGWVFELETIIKFRENTVTELVGLKHADRTDYVQRLCAAIVIDENMVSSRSALQTNSVIVPTSWCQGCFDLIHYQCDETDTQKKKYKVLVMNATRALEHKFKFQYVAEFLQKLFPLHDGMETRATAPSTPPAYDIEVSFVVVFPNAESVAGFKCGRVDFIEAVQNFEVLPLMLILNVKP